ncbi:MAG: hypothetical protein ABFS19_06920 [Thermodesulfobacteriota bacterium]
MKHKDLCKIFENGATSDPLDEILYLLDIIAPGINRPLIEETHQEVGRFFSGSHPNFKPSNTRYHNLTHTYSVALATSRLFHGLHCEGRRFDDDIILQGMISAYFHDTGLLLTASDPATTGAEYTINHEERSVSFMNYYLKERGIDQPFMDNCAEMINCTNLDLDPSTLNFSSEDQRIAGYTLGSSDILAQMADRYYLERLPHLYQEMKAGGINQYSSVIELMQQTTNFYHHVIINRLESVYKDLQQAMRTHFRERWDINKNLYMDNIDKNIIYIMQIVQECEDKITCLATYLRRTPPSF